MKHLGTATVRDKERRMHVCFSSADFLPYAESRTQNQGLPTLRLSLHTSISISKIISNRPAMGQPDLDSPSQTHPWANLSSLV